MPCVTHAARCCGRPRSLLVQSGWCHSSFPIRSGHVPVSGVGETLLLEVSTLNAHAVHRHLCRKLTGAPHLQPAHCRQQ